MCKFWNFTHGIFITTPLRLVTREGKDNAVEVDTIPCNGDYAMVEMLEKGELDAVEVINDDAEMNGHLSKPIVMDEVVKTIARNLNQ